MLTCWLPYSPKYFNRLLSLDTGRVSSDWTKANVIAIFKKGKRSTSANYRPVSLTSVICKVQEHIIFSNIMDHAA